MINGAIAGLVCITPAAGYVNMTGAFFIGFIGGPLCYGGIQLKHKLGYDDALDAFGVHAIGGIIGGILVGFFATDKVSGGSNGVFYAGMHVGGRQLAMQIVGILFSIGWSFVGTYLILKVLDMTIGLRVSPLHEDEGKYFHSVRFRLLCCHFQCIFTVIEKMRSRICFCIFTINILFIHLFFTYFLSIY